MKNKITKSNKFSFLTALYITLLQTFLLFVYLYFFGLLNLYFLCSWTVFSFLFSFVLIHFRFEKYIYYSIKKIYQDFTLL